MTMILFFSELRRREFEDIQDPEHLCETLYILCVSAADKKKLQLAEKYEQLKKSGKLENFLSKKRKRNTMKDRRKLPGQQSMKKP